MTDVAVVFLGHLAGAQVAWLKAEGSVGLV